jgi:hypothetical protein
MSVRPTQNLLVRNKCNLNVDCRYVTVGATFSCSIKIEKFCDGSARHGTLADHMWHECMLPVAF